MRRGANRQRRGPGLLGTVGRTAVIAGTATVVSSKVDNKMQASEQQRAAAQQQQLDTAVQQALSQQPAVTTSGPTDRIAQLQQLAELKQQGILSEAEFEAEKARILQS